ncbi:hypothetical protein [Marinibactrum halimedae]|uniref:Uncharacterized protein n=1 Tax=Marinibactrum halimedae TaxID=1444977 RepID=A0AA37T8Y7_9GAMM|nr:hypothetical protein [Marinibactrum halimedae]MCD9458862.1 hypothetical protein [Marinibactrum halimedae]GLS27714.1 hypothetical protein GCM10007877_34330 [Marinibactrum halimedae]
MKKKPFLHLPTLTVFIFFLFGASYSFGQCPIPSSEPVFRSESRNIQQYEWRLNNAQAWLEVAQTPVDEFIASFHDYVSANTDLDQYGLLRRQQDIFARYVGPNDDAVLSIQALLDGDAATIGKATCLDQLLLSGQLQRVDPSMPTEFQADIFKQGDQLRIYVAWRTVANYSGPPVDLSTRDRRNLIRSGWEFYTSLHNHPFFFGNIDIAGTIIASSPDLNLYRNYYSTYPLGSARITNGIDSAIYSEMDVDYLSLFE